MKTLFFLLFSLTGLAAFGQQKVKPISVADSTKKIQVVETACGQCQFGLKEKGCLLAVRINAVRKAEVQGTLVKGRFNVTYFKLLPAVVVPGKEQH